MRFKSFTGPKNPIKQGKNAKVAKSTRVCPPFRRTPCGHGQLFLSYFGHSVSKIGPLAICESCDPLPLPEPHPLRVCVPGRMPISGLRPEIGKNSPKNRFWPHPENRETITPKKEKWPENRFLSDFSYFWAIFSLFSG